MTGKQTRNTKKKFKRVKILMSLFEALKAAGMDIKSIEERLQYFYVVYGDEGWT